ncbi:unnamed protein product [Debaryomyces fabryi]|nr:unnamed protein product [Debaryomyces fabryi]
MATLDFTTKPFALFLFFLLCKKTSMYKPTGAMPLHYLQAFRS